MRGLRRSAPTLLAIVAALASGCATVGSKPVRLGGFDHDGYQKHAQTLRTFDAGGAVRRIRWSDESVTYDCRGRRYTFIFATGDITESVIPGTSAQAAPAPRRGPGRGRQRSREPSPDGRWVAVSRDWNVVLEPGDDVDEGGQSIDVTTDGHRKFRYGTASWVYGEELRQQTAMWWSPDSKKLVFYEFDEGDVPDYHLLGDRTKRRPSLRMEGYPKPGEPNPRASLLVYDVESGTTSRLDTHPDDGDEWYLYGIRMRADGVLLAHRTNRGQNRLELIAVDVETGTSRVLVTERQATWQKNAPDLRFLDDGRFIWETERNGVRQYELHAADGQRLATLSSDAHPVTGIAHVDESTGVVFFTAYGDDHPLHEHLYRVNLDGTALRQLTPPGRSHTINVSPDGRLFIARSETLTDMPTTVLYDAHGKHVATLAESDPSTIDALGLPPPELFVFRAEDGAELFGWLCKPPGFDPRRRYPLVIDVYAGPESKGVRARYRAGHPGCHHGVVVAKIDGRGTGGRGKDFVSAVYLNLGTVDLADQVAGVEHLLTERAYLDPARVGIYGHSYGGYMAALAILKYPDVFRVAVASAPVTDWRNYDTIYTERYMRTPDENPDGYDAGSCMTYAASLRGDLLLMHGLIDDNVHPTNTWQLVEAIRAEGGSVDLEIYPNGGHGLGRGASRTRWAYLHRHLAQPAE